MRCASNWVSSGNNAIPIAKGELIRPDIDPSVLNAFSKLEIVNNERLINQNGIRDKLLSIKANENNFDAIKLISPFLAITAPKSLK